MLFKEVEEGIVDIYIEYEFNTWSQKREDIECLEIFSQVVLWYYFLEWGLGIMENGNLL